MLVLMLEVMLKLVLMSERAGWSRNEGIVSSFAFARKSNGNFTREAIGGGG